MNNATQPTHRSRMAARVCLVLACVLAAVPSWAAFENSDVEQPRDVRISFHRANVIRGKEIRLGEIANIEAKSEKQRKQLEVLVMGRTPAMGYRQRMYPSQIAAILRGLGIDDSNAVIETPKTVIIEREVQQVDLKRLAEAVRNAALDKISFPVEEAVIEDINLPDELTLNAGELRWDIEVRVPRDGVGNGSYNIDLLVSGDSERRISGVMRIDREVEVYEASRAVRRGETVSASICKPVVRRLSTVRGQALESGDFSGPLEAKRDMKPGQAMTWRNVARRLLVKRGQSVRMVLQSDDGMRISAVGQARDDGSMGDLVEVMNVSSGKRINAIVAGNRTVRVPF